MATDLESVKRILGLSNGTEPVFLRTDLARQEYLMIRQQNDTLSAQVAEIGKELMEIKLLLAKQGG